MQHTPIHHISTVPAATLPGMVIITFHEPLPDITTPGGTPGKLSQTGCEVSELDTFLAGLEAQHGIQIVRPGMALLSNPLTGTSAVRLIAGPL